MLRIEREIYVTQIVLGNLISFRVEIEWTIYKKLLLMEKRRFSVVYTLFNSWKIYLSKQDLNIYKNNSFVGRCLCTNLCFLFCL